MDHDQNFRELSVDVISLFNICVKHEIWKWQLYPFIMIFRGKKLSITKWFHVKWLKLRKRVVNGNSQNRTWVKRNSVICWKLFWSMNFLGMWIHWISSKYARIAKKILSWRFADITCQKNISFPLVNVDFFFFKTIWQICKESVSHYFAF